MLSRFIYFGRLRVLASVLVLGFSALSSVSLGADVAEEGVVEVGESVKVAQKEQIMDKEKESGTKEEEPEDEMALEENDASEAAVARPVSRDLVQVYGWRENVVLDGVGREIVAKLDTGALTSSIHAEEKELFERDGKKWVRFIVTEPRKKDSPRTRMEAPLVRVARIKEPGGDSTSREVVRLNFKIGEKKLRGDFTLNNRSNMLAAVLIGRTTIKELGWVDSGRTFLADERIFR